MEEKLLGFTAREMWSYPGAAWVGETLHPNYWTPLRKNEYLLRDDVKRPLSTSYGVWPTVFGFNAGIQMGGPDHSGFVQDLWSNLDELVKAVQLEWSSAPKRHWVIAVTLLWGECNQEVRKTWASVFEPVFPPAPSSEWQFLGYDVSDRYLLSGLSYCLSSRLPDFSRLKGEWGVHLNEYHLFEDRRKAVDFRSMIDGLIDQHAPFSIYGLWRVQ